jgi:hypothetical protein
MAKAKSFATLPIMLWLLLASSAAASGQSNLTTTTLMVSAGSVAAGTAVTLSATVTGQVAPVNAGQVTFCDATATHCDGAAVFGVAQVTSAGTATIRRTLGVGTYSIAAMFSGLSGAGGSVSPPQAVTVTGAGNYGSVSAITASGGVGDYTLTATVTAFGKPPASGPVSFLDASYGDGELASAALSLPTLAAAFRQGSGSPLPANFAQFVVSADFNGDGIPDLAVASLSASGGVSVFMGNGDGSFRPAVNYGAGVNPQMIAVADVNGDGALDLMVANHCADEACATGSVSILLGLGDGRFQPAISFASGRFATFVSVGDFNGDGWPDLALVNGQDDTVSILLGTGDARLFQPQIAYPVGASPEGVAIGDFNQDGLQDLAVSNSGEATVSILLGNGDGTFRAQQRVPLPASVSPCWLVAADLRSIGTLDLVVPDAAASNEVYVLLGNGDGSFQAALGYPVNAGQYEVSIGDLNGDGILDLVVPDNIENGHVSVLLGVGDGTFGQRKDYPVGSNPTSVALADFNGDGVLDLATSDNGSSTATILLQAQTETATAVGVALFPAGTHNVLASYPGDTDRAPSRSTTVALLGSSPTPTSTTLAASPNPAAALQTVSLSAAVAPVPGGSAAGTVSFYNAAVLLGTVGLNSSGMAAFSTTSLPVGLDSLTAIYSGNAGFAASTSTPLAETIIAPASPTATTTSLAASPNPAVALQTVFLSAAVAPVPGGSVPGTVSFYNGAMLLGTVGLNSSGRAAFSTTTLPVGGDSLTATYSGNAGFAASTSTPVAETITASGGSTNPSFSVTALPASMAIAAGGSGEIDVSVLSVNGIFNGVVTMSAAGIPPGTTASFVAPTVIPGSAGAATVLTIQPAATGRVAGPLGRIPFAAFATAMALCGLGGKPKWRCLRIRRGLALTALALAAFPLVGCLGGGFLSNPSSPTGPSSTSTIPKSYIVTITGTSGSLQASAFVTVAVP